MRPGFSASVRYSLLKDPGDPHNSANKLLGMVRMGWCAAGACSHWLGDCVLRAHVRLGRCCTSVTQVIKSERSHDEYRVTVELFCGFHADRSRRDTTAHRWGSCGQGRCGFARAARHAVKVRRPVEGVKGCARRWRLALADRRVGLALGVFVQGVASSVSEVSEGRWSRSRSSLVCAV